MFKKKTVNEMCQIDEIVFFKTKIDLTSDFVSFQNLFFRSLITSYYPTWQPFESWWKVAEGPLLSCGMVSLGLSLNVGVLL